MPYLPASTQAPVSAERAQITLNADKRVAATGEPVTFSGTVTGVTLPTSVYIEVYVDGTKADEWGPLMTDEKGAFDTVVAMPYRFGCKDVVFRAVHKETGGVSNEVRVAVAFNTRVTLDVPGKVAVNTPFKVTGRLEYEESEGVWKPLAGKQVTVLLDGELYDTVTTGSDGSFSLDMVIDTPGDHTIDAKFGGEGMPATVTVFGATLEVSPLVSALRYLAAAAPIIATGAVVAYTELKRRGAV